MSRFERFLLDGGFWIGDVFVEPIWSVNDNMDRDSPVTFIEFKNEYKDLCDDFCKFLNQLNERISTLEKENNELKQTLSNNIDDKLEIREIWDERNKKSVM